LGPSINVYIVHYAAWRWICESRAIAIGVIHETACRREEHEVDAEVRKKSWWRMLSLSMGV